MASPSPVPEPTDRGFVMRWSYLLPWYWPTWIGLGFVRAMVLLPFHMQMAVFAVLGSLSRLVLPGHVRIARRNIGLCFPEKTAAERERILRAHFRSLGMMVGEAAAAWWLPPSALREIGGSVEGIENIDHALKAGKGAIVLTAHFTTIEIGCGFSAAARPICLVYKPSKNALLNEILAARRGAMSDGAFVRDNIRSMVHALRRNKVVCYAPDQAYRRRDANMVPFFGIPAATNTATSRLAKITGAKVLPAFARRLPNGGYRLVLLPPFENFPSDDPVADARRFHELIEAEVRRAPEQYLWVHRRFKGLDPDYPDYYS